MQSLPLLSSAGGAEETLFMVLSASVAQYEVRQPVICLAGCPGHCSRTFEHIHHLMCCAFIPCGALKAILRAVCSSFLLQADRFNEAA